MEAELATMPERELRAWLVSAPGEIADLIAGEMERRDIGDWPPDA